MTPEEHADRLKSYLVHPPMGGSSPDYCERLTPEGHAYEAHTYGGNPIYLRICTFCRYIDWENLKVQAENIRAEERQRVISQFTEYIRSRPRHAFEESLAAFIRDEPFKEPV